MPADFVSTVNADMRVGTLEETVTVTGESPIVDVQSARRRRTLDENLIESIPTAQGYASVMVLMPSMIVSGGGNANVQISPGMIVFGGRGGRGNEGIAQTDGIGTGAAINGGGVSGYGRLDTTEEVVLTSSRGPRRCRGRRPDRQPHPAQREQTVREPIARLQDLAGRCRGATTRRSSKTPACAAPRKPTTSGIRA